MSNSLIIMAERMKQVNWPFAELGLGQESLLQQLEEELAHVVPCYLTALQSRLHPNTHKDVDLRAQVELVHTLDSLLQKTRTWSSIWIPLVIFTWQAIKQED